MEKKEFKTERKRNKKKNKKEIEKEIKEFFEKYKIERAELIENKIIEIPPISFNKCYLVSLKNEDSESIIKKYNRATDEIKKVLSAYMGTYPDSDSDFLIPAFFITNRESYKKTELYEIKIILDFIFSTILRKMGLK